MSFRDGSLVYIIPEQTPSAVRRTHLSIGKNAPCGLQSPKFALAWFGIQDSTKETACLKLGFFNTATFQFGQTMNRTLSLIVISVIAMSFQMAASQETASPDSDAAQRVGKYRLVEVEGDDEFALQMIPQSAMNWSNPVFGTTSGGFFLWTRDGHVAAVMKTYKTKSDRWFEQMRSFSVHPIVARQTRDAAAFWSPPAAPEMKPLEGSPVPASTATARLIQMKALHRSFSVTGKLQSGRQELRPLPRPLYRYDSKTAFDGAMFAYVQGTSPDMLLILEARKTADQPRWYYSLGSIGIFEVEVQRNGVTVWSEERRTAQSTKPTDIYDGRRLAD